MSHNADTFPVMTTPKTNQPGRPVPGAGEAGKAQAAVPAIPQWVKEWGFIPLLVAFLILSAMIANVGHAHGTGTGWFLFFLLLAAYAGAWAWDYDRRLGGARTALRLELHAQSCLEAVDAMTGHQFEFYYARLLECLGWTRIQVTGEKPGGDGGADILATDTRNRDFAIQCKRYAPAKAVAIGDVRELNGALAHEHPNRLGMIVTTSRLTPPAEQLAARTGIRVVARPALASQMALMRDAADRRNGRTATAAPAAELP
jgi:restriction system protein